MRLGPSRHESVQECAHHAARRLGVDYRAIMIRCAGGERVRGEARGLSSRRPVPDDRSRETGRQWYSGLGGHAEPEAWRGAAGPLWRGFVARHLLHPYR